MCVCKNEKEEYKMLASIVASVGSVLSASVTSIYVCSRTIDVLLNFYRWILLAICVILIEYQYGSTITWVLVGPLVVLMATSLVFDCLYLLEIRRWRTNRTEVLL